MKSRIVITALTTLVLVISFLSSKASPRSDNHLSLPPDLLKEEPLAPPECERGSPGTCPDSFVGRELEGSVSGNVNSVFFIDKVGGSPEDDLPPYALQNDTVATLFGEGVISTRDDEFGGTFTGDGKTCFFSKSVLHFYLETICYSQFIDGKWSTPEIAPFSGVHRSFDPTISPDGNKILFTSDRPVHGEKKTDFDIWMVEKTADGWSEPMRLDSSINSQYDEHFASMSSNGTIYFSSNRPGAVGGDGDADIYRCKLVNGKYSQAEHMSDSINSPSYLLDCTIAPDESFLLIGYYGRPDGYGSYDIYISKQVDGKWTSVKNLGPKVNGRFRDYSPRITPDGQYLFFTSERDFSQTTRTSPYSYEELTNNFRSVLNGSGNIYQIELNALGIKPPGK